MSSESLPLTVLQQIDRICDSFEDAWRAGARPKIEEFLGNSTIVARTALFRELLAREIELRKRGGETPEAADYERRFAGHGDLIRTVLGEPHDKDETAIVQPDSTEAESGEPVPAIPVCTDPATTGDRAAFWDRNRPRGLGDVVVPERIGRFRPIRLLGRGNFLVFLAHDDQRGRDVAIKVARPDDPFSQRRLMSLSEEAQRLAALDHPGIVKLHEYVSPRSDDLDPTAGADGFIVLEYVNGPTLEALFSEGVMEPCRLAVMAAAVAEAVHHAHTAGLVHRDLKPSNILIDAADRPRVCDFGLAIDEEIQWLRRGEVAGTLPYMAPEQVRGETNRLDGRTDIWAIGVILYRGLTGRLPFRGERTVEVFEEILNREPRPPRQYGDAIPRELERICLRCLSRPMGDRYLTAADLAEDLRRWLADSRREPASTVVAPLAVPRGLRSFGGEDAASFLSLLPGPRGSDGLPESIRFWKSRVEADGGPLAFSVGLLYGPSGGGKSSFVRAGLLPQLDHNKVRPIAIEATPEGLEHRLLKEIQSRIPRLPRDADLAEAIALVREDPTIRTREKLLLVLDQFEQWLQGRALEEAGLLIRALRQCDGRRIQVLLLVRDDFWMATTRLLRAVEVPLLEGANAAAVELFDARHARRVLDEFGRSLGQLGGEGRATPARDEEAAQFLDEATNGLTGPDGRIIPVRLSLFVEVVRHRPWTMQTLRALGGMEGIGVKFLEQTFDSATAAPGHRLQRSAAEAVLGLLLPAPGSVLRGLPRSARALRSASGHEAHSAEFADLIQVLDHELRLITPVEVRTSVEEGGEDLPEGLSPASSGETHYQLAHDYLIRPIRQWLERKQQFTREGRARLRLQAVTASWHDHPGSHRLPSLLEYVGILHNIRPAEWSLDERRMMRAATRHYLSRTAVAVLLALALTAGVRALLERQEARYALLTAFSAKDRELPEIALQLAPYRTRVIAPLEARERRSAANDPSRVVAGVLLYEFAPTNERGEYLRDLLLKAPDPDRVDLLRGFLSKHPGFAGVEELRQIVAREDSDGRERLRAACALTVLQTANHPLLEAAAPALTLALLEDGGRYASGWLKLLGPAEAAMVPSLGDKCRDRELNPVVRATAAEALGEVLRRRGDPRSLAEMAVQSFPDAYEILLRELLNLGQPQPAIEFLRSAAAFPLANPDEGQRDDAPAERQALAVIALDALGEKQVLSDHLAYRPDPRVRALIIQRMAASRLDRQRRLERLVASNVDPGERQAMLMIWVETPLRDLNSQVRQDVVQAAHRLFKDDPDPGVHAAAELLLDRWDAHDLVAKTEQELRGRGGTDPRMQWRLGPEGHTMVRISAPIVFRMGSPDTESGHFANESLHFRGLNHSFEVATREVTIAQYRAFDARHGPDGRYSHGLEWPVNEVKWHEAAGYCNWLSARAGIPPDQWCYSTEIGPGMRLAEGSVDRTGYRLPTEAEWEYICRAGTTTSRYFGVSEDLFPRYGWTWLNSHDQASPVGRLLPNPWGFFDTLGNLWEWCHDGSLDVKLQYQPYPKGTSMEKPWPDQVAGGLVTPLTFRVMRGGAFCYSPGQARAAYRYAVTTNYGEGTYGFRVARTLPASK